MEVSVRAGRPLREKEAKHPRGCPMFRDPGLNTRLSRAPDRVTSYVGDDETRNETKKLPG